jgi:hypothetical protein
VFAGDVVDPKVARTGEATDLASQGVRLGADGLASPARDRSEGDDQEGASEASSEGRHGGSDKVHQKAVRYRLIRPVESAIIRAVWIFATESEMAAEVWGRFTVHYTPTHGSWLNQAEIEIGIFSRECLGKHEFPTLRRCGGKPRPGIVG